MNAPKCGSHSIGDFDVHTPHGVDCPPRGIRPRGATMTRFFSPVLTRIRPLALRGLILMVAVGYASLATDVSIDHASTPRSGWTFEEHWHGDTRHLHMVQKSAPGTEPVDASNASERVEAQTTGVLKALVVNLVRADGFAVPRETVAARFAEAAQMIVNMSRGMATPAVDLFPRDVVYAVDGSICDTWFGQVERLDAEVGREVDLKSYRLITYVLPRYDGEACSYGGVAILSGHHSAVVAYWPEWAGRISVSTIAHEWGHNLGLAHLSLLRCVENGVPVAFASAEARAARACSRDEYGGSFSVMGDNWFGALTFGERRLLGWVRAGEVVRAHDTTITLGSDGPVSLAWVKNAAGELFQIEFVKAVWNGRWCVRTSPVGWDYRCFDSPEGLTHDGVLVKHVERVVGYRDYHVQLDMRPDTYWAQDGAIAVGQSWTDPTGSLTISVLSSDGASATVSVTGASMGPTSRPGLLTARVVRSSGTLQASWQKPADPSVDRYVLSYSASCFTADSGNSVTTTKPSATVKLPKRLLQRGGELCVAVAAANADGTGEYGPIVRVTVPRS